MAAEWTNNGSIKDISDLAKDSLATDSMHGGNQVWARTSMSAPGGASGDLGNDVGSAVVVSAPVIEMQGEIEPGTDGKPKARNSSGHAPGEPAWAKTTSPNVVREK
jgi:hypothetical protein